MPQKFLGLATSLSDDNEYFVPSQKVVKQAVDSKQDILTAGNGITINGNIIQQKGLTTYVYASDISLLVNDLVLYNNQLYLTTTAHTTTSTFDPTKFTLLLSSSPEWHSATYTLQSAATSFSFTLTSPCRSLSNLFVYIYGKLLVPTENISLAEDGVTVTITNTEQVEADTLFEIRWC
jgi:hypothetical protein